MNVMLIRQTCRQILMSPFRMAVALVLVVLPVVEQALSLSTTVDVPNATVVTTFLIGGICSADARSGLQRVVLARPVERWRYILCRFAGSLLAAWLVLGGALLASGLVIGLVGEAIPARALAGALARLLFTLAPVTAFFVAASAILPLLMDVVAFFGVFIVHQMAIELPIAGVRSLLPLTSHVLDFLRAPTWAGPADLALATLSASGVMLGLGILAFNRRSIAAEARS